MTSSGLEPGTYRLNQIGYHRLKSVFEKRGLMGMFGRQRRRKGKQRQGEGAVVLCGQLLR
jgi:hypothetical protein